ncbi:YkgJ family cysteine cluster protein [Sulfolobus tengchongensis]|uniref:YkgJ family cysteine cluster protein n=1 Tax=Sulfolobus tengchongensis TaxID=207809 RepID=A0AAX4L4W3_9CREN
MSFDTNRINLMVKKGLRGELDHFEKVLDFLERYSTVPQAKFGMYSLVFQIAMNVFIDVAKDCEECGGKCCKSGYPVPVYNFDYNELKKKLNRDDLKKLNKVDNNLHVLPRPCPFQKGWLCGIHGFKPYACLSFPFATEDEQETIINRYNGDGIPDFNVPDYCIAGIKVKNILGSIIEDLKNRLGRPPSPRELYQELKARYGRK